MLVSFGVCIWAIQDDGGGHICGSQSRIVTGEIPFFQCILSPPGCSQ